MMEGYQTKEMQPEPAPKNVTMTPASVLQNRYHFAGEGLYEAISIEASTIEEATNIWKQKRVPLAFTKTKTPAPASAAAPEKPEEQVAPKESEPKE